MKNKHTIINIGRQFGSGHRLEFFANAHQWYILELENLADRA